MLKELDRKILRILLDRRAPVSSKELALLCGVSVNTMRKEIGLINEALEAEGFYIALDTSSGCYVKVTDEVQANASMIKWQYLLNRAEHMREQDDSYILYLIRRCLSANGNLTVESLCEELYCSRSTLMRNLDEVKKSLGRFRLTLRNRRGHGITVEGSEWDLRQCLIYQHKIYKLSVGGEEYRDTAFKALFFSLGDENHYLEIRQLFMNCLIEQEDFLLPVNSYSKITHYIQLSASRAKASGKICFTEEQVSRVVNTAEYRFVRKLCRRLAEANLVCLKEGDQIAVAMLILSCETENRRLEEYQEYPRYQEETRELISLLAEQWGYPLGSFDDVFVRDWICFLYTLENRQRFGVYSDAEAQGIVWNQGIRTADFCICFARWYEKRHGIRLTHRDTISAFYLFRRITKMGGFCWYAQNILIVSQYGLWFAESLAASIRSEYGREIRHITVREYGEKWEDDYRKYDLLITDLGGTRLHYFDHYHLPVLVVNFQLKRERFPELDEYLRVFRRKRELTVITEECFHGTDLKTREEVFRYLAELHRKLMEPQEMLVQLRENDRYLDLERDNGIVFLPVFAKSMKPQIEVLLNRTPILWNSRDCRIFVCYSRTNSLEANQIMGEILKRFVHISAGTAHSMISRQKGSPLEYLYMENEQRR